MPTYRVEAVVLRVRALGEADKLLTLFARGRGKLKAVARGARRTKSRLMGAAQLFSRVEASMWKGRSLDGVSQCEVLESNRKLREDLVGFGCASYAAEIVDFMVRENDVNDAAYGILVSGLRALCEACASGWNQGDLATPSEIAVRWMQARFLDAFGYAPQIWRCVACGAAVQAAGEATSIFDAASGGLLCAGCLHHARSRAHRVSHDALRLLRALSRMPLERAVKESAPRAAAMETGDILEDHLAFHAERRPRSSTFMRSILQEGVTGS